METGPLTQARTTLFVGLSHRCEALVDNRPVLLTKERATALLALLAIAAPQPVARETLRGLLWSDKSEADAQNSLRNALWALRHALETAGYTGLQASRSHVWLEGGALQTDLSQALADLDDGQIATVLRPDQGFPDRILADLTGPDLLDLHLADFRVAAKRQVVQRANAALGHLSGQARIDVLAILSELDPLNEAAARNLMAALIGAGRKADALATYQKLWTLLDDAFGEEPSGDTQALIVALKQADTGPPGDDGKPLIVVLQDDGTPPHDAALRDLRDLALSALARFREWRILDQKFLTDLQDVRRTARGPVSALALTMPTPGQARARLTDLANGQVLWSETLILPEQGRFSDFDAPLRKLATALNLHLTGPRRPPPVTGSGEDLLYERWLQAQDQFRRFTPAGWDRAEQVLDGILTERPGFVRALVTRAAIETMRQIVFPGISSSPQMHRRALQWANAAVLADPMDSRAQLALGWAYAMARQFDRADIAFELAIQANENDPWTITSCLVGFAFCDRDDRARALLDYLQSLHLTLDPVHWSYLAAAAFMLGDDRACARMSDRAQDVSVDVPAWHAAALAHGGQVPAARARADAFRRAARAAWTGPAAPSDREITAWLLSCFPIRSRDTWTRLRSGLAMAGLDVGD